LSTPCDNRRHQAGTRVHRTRYTAAYGEAGGVSPTRRELVRATRARILDAAARLTRERGVNGFSMDVLAKEAGVARATVYEHFRSKRAVLDELASASTRTLTLDRHTAALGDPLTALRDLLGAVCRHWEENGATVRELRGLLAVTGSEVPIDGVDPAYLRQIVAGLDAAGQLRPRWTAEEAVDALALLTSYPTYERLRGAPHRTPEEVEALLAKLAVSVVTPNGSGETMTPNAAATSGPPTPTARS
jgi:AcrR family transcriptional regulator